MCVGIPTTGGEVCRGVVEVVNYCSVGGGEDSDMVLVFVEIVVEMMVVVVVVVRDWAVFVVPLSLRGREGLCFLVR